LSLNELKKFLNDLRSNKELLKLISNAGTADEIASIAEEFGYEFSGQELKTFDQSNYRGVRITKQDTSPSYNFGESGN